MTSSKEITRFDGLLLAREYRASRERISSIVSAQDDTMRVPVPACPAWNLHDLCAHVTGIAVDLSAGRVPKGDSQPWVDRQVDERRKNSTAEVLSEWSAVADSFEGMIERDPRAMWGLVYDVIVHEFDARNALGDRSGREASGVRVAAELGLKLVKADLRRAGLGAMSVDLEGEEIVVGEGTPSLRLRTTPFECLRLLGSRRTYSEIERADFEGDVASFANGLFHMDLPVHSLGE